MRRPQRAALGIAISLALLTAACGPSDASIGAAVTAKHSADDMVKGAAITVDAKNGIVTLVGAVDSEAVRRRAVDLARQVSGVLSVIDSIGVAYPPATSDSAPSVMGHERMERRKHEGR
jgi:hypothetical protein